LGSTQQLDELLKASVGMANREEWKLHASPLLRCVFKGANLMGRDMIGLVALDFVLRIVFRSVMDMTLVVGSVVWIAMIVPARDQLRNSSLHDRQS
jgi:hypothetical protein